MFAAGVGVRSSQLVINPTRVLPEISWVLQHGKGDFQHFRDFVLAGLEGVGIGNGPDEDSNAEIAASHYVVQFSQDGNVASANAHFLFGFPESGIEEIPILRVPGAAGERDLPFVVFDQFGPLVKEDMISALLGIKQQEDGGGHEVRVGYILLDSLR